MLSPLENLKLKGQPNTVNYRRFQVVIRVPCRSEPMPSAMCPITLVYAAVQISVIYGKILAIHLNWGRADPLIKEKPQNPRFYV